MSAWHATFPHAWMPPPLLVHHLKMTNDSISVQTIAYLYKHTASALGVTRRRNNVKDSEAAIQKTHTALETMPTDGIYPISSFTSIARGRNLPTVFLKPTKAQQPFRLMKPTFEILLELSPPL